MIPIMGIMTMAWVGALACVVLVTRFSAPQAASVETQQTDFERTQSDFDEMRQFCWPPVRWLQMIFNCWKCEEGWVIYYRTRVLPLIPLQSAWRTARNWAGDLLLSRSYIFENSGEKKTKKTAWVTVQFSFFPSFPPRNTLAVTPLC